MANDIKSMWKQQPSIGGSLIRAAQVRYITYRLMTVPCSSPEFMFTTHNRHITDSSGNQSHYYSSSVLWHCWLGGRKGIRTVKNGGWRWALLSPDGVAPIWMVSVSASVDVSLYHKFQKFSSGSSSPGWSQKKGRKTVECVYVCVCVYYSSQLPGETCVYLYLYKEFLWPWHCYMQKLLLLKLF